MISLARLRPLRTARGLVQRAAYSEQHAGCLEWLDERVELCDCSLKFQRCYFLASLRHPAKDCAGRLNTLSLDKPGKFAQQPPCFSATTGEVLDLDVSFYAQLAVTSDDSKVRLPASREEYCR